MDCIIDKSKVSLLHWSLKFRLSIQRILDILSHIPSILNGVTFWNVSDLSCKIGSMLYAGIYYSMSKSFIELRRHFLIVAVSQAQLVFQQILNVFSFNIIFKFSFLLFNGQFYFSFIILVQVIVVLVIRNVIRVLKA